MENKNKHTDLEVVKVGYANGVSPNFPLSDKEKEKITTFINKNKEKYTQKTQNELNGIIEFMSSNMVVNDAEVSALMRYDYIKGIEELQGGNFENISPVKITS